MDWNRDQQLHGYSTFGSPRGVRTIRRTDRSSSNNSGDRRHRRDCVGEKEEIPEKMAFDERCRGGGSTVRGEEGAGSQYRTEATWKIEAWICEDNTIVQ